MPLYKFSYGPPSKGPRQMYDRVVRAVQRAAADLGRAPIRDKDVRSLRMNVDDAGALRDECAPGADLQDFLSAHSAHGITIVTDPGLSPGQIDVELT